MLRLPLPLLPPVEILPYGANCVCVEENRERSYQYAQLRRVDAGKTNSDKDTERKKQSRLHGTEQAKSSRGVSTRRLDDWSCR